MAGELPETGDLYVDKERGGQMSAPIVDNWGWCFGGGPVFVRRYLVTCMLLKTWDE